jgi:hypothetical protein
MVSSYLLESSVTDNEANLVVEILEVTRETES